MNTAHDTLTAALSAVEDLVTQGFTSFKLFRELGVWYIVVNESQGVVK